VSYAGCTSTYKIPVAAGSTFRRRYAKDLFAREPRKRLFHKEMDSPERKAMFAVDEII
jgi:hypothetical protein